jgi:hypothetical protein
VPVAPHAVDRVAAQGLVNLGGGEFAAASVSAGSIA